LSEESTQRFARVVDTGGMKISFALVLLAACKLPAAATSTGPAPAAHTSTSTPGATYDDTGPATAHTSSSTAGHTYENAQPDPGTQPAQTHHLAPGAEPSSQAAVCDATDDQCIPAECIFVMDPDAPAEAYVAYPTDQGAYVFVRDDIMGGHPRTLSTVAATRGNVHAGDTVLVLGFGDEAPYSEEAAIRGTWAVHTVTSISGDTVTFDHGDAQLIATRVVR
jgi:hypothetical protein